MTDIDEVIQAVETAFDVWIDEYTGCSNFKEDKVRQMKENALELLKEQEPVVVYESKISRCACGNTVNRYWHPKFCGYCGKELMWY